MDCGHCDTKFTGLRNPRDAYALAISRESHVGGLPVFCARFIEALYCTTKCIAAQDTAEQSGTDHGFPGLSGCGSWTKTVVCP